MTINPILYMNGHHSIPSRRVDRLPASTSESGISTLSLPRIFFGGGVYGLAYSSQSFLDGEEPARTLRSAFDAGLLAIDTSPFYTTSEELLGRLLSESSFAADFPRESYQLITKCGRYGTKRADFDYSPKRIEASIKRSCELLRTDYLDGVYLHDIEFVAEDVGGAGKGGYHLDCLLPKNLTRYGLHPSQHATSHGPGDDIILEALRTLFRLKDANVIKAVGIAGYPLPTLLRIARLATTVLSRPLDILQSYSHLTLHNRALLTYAPLLSEAGAKQIVNASPLSMGLLRSAPPQKWHPAPVGLRSAVSTSGVDQPEKAALRYGLRAGWDAGIPTVVGSATVDELNMAVEAYEEGRGGRDEEAEKLRKSIEQSTFADWSWASPPPL